MYSTESYYFYILLLEIFEIFFRLSKHTFETLRVN